jgi:hypothetical protein
MNGRQLAKLSNAIEQLSDESDVCYELIIDMLTGLCFDEEGAVELKVYLEKYGPKRL